jgi:hypothetical protein
MKQDTLLICGIAMDGEIMYGYMETMQLHKGGVGMKSLIALSLLIMFIISPVLAAEDWSQYESGRDNIRLDGYHSQPGYISFADGNGVVRGYLFADSNGRLRWRSCVFGGVATSGALNLKTDGPITDATGTLLDYYD